MARGWESKSVESQQTDAADGRRQQPDAKGTDPASLEILRKKQTLMLSRTRVMRDLETSQNARYREMLNHALADLDAQLAALAKMHAGVKAATAS